MIPNVDINLLLFPVITKSALRASQKEKCLYNFKFIISYLEFIFQ